MQLPKNLRKAMFKRSNRSFPLVDLSSYDQQTISYDSMLSSRKLVETKHSLNDPVNIQYVSKL